MVLQVPLHSAHRFREKSTDPPDPCSATRRIGQSIRLANPGRGKE